MAPNRAPVPRCARHGLNLLLVAALCSELLLRGVAAQSAAGGNTTGAVAAVPAAQQQAQQQNTQQQQPQGSPSPPPAFPDPNDAKAPAEVQDAVVAADQQALLASNGSSPAAAADSAGTPGVSATQGASSPINLASQPGCSGGSLSGFLPPGLDGSCTMQGVVGRRETDLFQFTLAPATNATRPYRVLLLLRTLDGAPRMGVSAPAKGTGITDVAPEGRGITIYQTESSGEQYVVISSAFVRQNPGRYIVSIANSTARSLYTLQVLTPFDDVQLLPSNLAVMRQLYESCCLAVASNSPFCTESLPQGLAADRLPEQDLCHLSPLTCNAKGELTRLTVPGAGLVCAAGLPANLTQLTALATLDIGYNAINNTVAEVAGIISAMPALQLAFVRYVGLRGTITCDLVAGPALKTLSISGNRITGTLPACILQSPSLEELFFSQTYLNGPLPDALPTDSRLRTLFNTNWPKAMRRPHMSGPLPTSLLSAPRLAYLNLANHEFSGGLSALPPALRLLNLSANSLGGAIPAALPPSLEVFDLSSNQLSGALPPDLSGADQLVRFDVQQNAFTGALPALAPGLVVLDVSNNQLQGAFSQALPASLRYLDASFNNITALPELPAASQLRYLLLSNNQLSGRLPPSLIGGNSAAQLQFLDLSQNQLSGQLDGSPAAAGGGQRRLLAAQLAGRTLLQAATAGGGGAAASSMPWAGLTSLGYLDLSANQFSGPVPAVLGSLPSLVYLDLSLNALSGSLKPFADALAAASNSTLVFLSVAGNELSGNVPAGLASASILDPSVQVLLAPGEPAPRVLDLSGNRFSGAFPSWLITQPPLVLEACQGCQLAVSLNGSDMQISCPQELEVTSQQLPFLQRAGFQCVNAAGQQVPLLSVASSLPAATAAPAAASNVDESLPDLKSQFYSPEAADRAQPAADFYDGASGSPTTADNNNSALQPGAIAGIVIGSVVGAALLAVAAAFAARRLCKWRQGWVKDDLNGGGIAGPRDAELNGPFGNVGALPPHLAAPFGTAELASLPSHLSSVAARPLPQASSGAAAVAGSMIVPSRSAGPIGSLKQGSGSIKAAGALGLRSQPGSNGSAAAPGAAVDAGGRHVRPLPAHQQAPSGLELMNSRVHDNVV